MTLSYSVVIPSGGRVAFLKEAIDSVLAQTHKATLCVVVMDASRDKFACLMGEYGERVWFLEGVPGGANSCRRYGAEKSLERSPTDAIAFLDDDDIWSADKIEKQVIAVLMSRASAYVVGSGWFVMKEDRVERVFGLTQADLRDNVQIDNPYGTFSNLMVSADLVQHIKAGLPACQDWDFVLRLWRNNVTLLMIPEPCLRYRVHGGVRITKNLSRRLDGLTSVYADFIGSLSGWARTLLRVRIAAASFATKKSFVGVLKVLGCCFLALSPGRQYSYRLRMIVVVLLESFLGYWAVECYRSAIKRLLPRGRFRQ